MKKHMGRNGFTLIELLVSMALVAALLLAAFPLMRSVIEAHAGVSTNAGCGQQAQTVMAQLRQDLRAVDGRGWRSADDDHWLGWHLLLPANRQCPESWIGDLCAVEYGVANLEHRESPGLIERCLMRLQHDSAEVQQAIQRGDGESLWSSMGGHPVASGVLAFEAKPLVRDAAAGWREWSAGTTAPDALEVRLVLAGKRMQARLRTAADWDAAFNTMKAGRLGPDWMVYQAILPVGVNEG